ncbi:MAG: iron hydrogenase small subunit [Oligoflexia bacterium]|nr:iron hydrogenase small subunit [Oligoflexia bacterium]MBF0366467.1 iron hydrogenase small subunit [Oligoflexia bacterium]
MPTTIKISVNGKEYNVRPGVTILEAIRDMGISVPTLCHLKNLSPTGACRLCVVEIDGVAGLVPSCSYPVSEGMVIKTHSPRTMVARKTIVELLLASHPNDCLYCERSRNCELSKLASEFGVTAQHFPVVSHGHHKDISSPSINRDPEKCILCGKCVRVCEEVQSVSALDFVSRGHKAQVAPAFNEGLNVSSCINCGQCVMVCPTGALTEKSNLKEVLAALSDKKKHTIIQYAPSISVTLAEEFGLKAGQDVVGKMAAAFRKIGFKTIFDTSFSADLTIMEEGSEFIHRLQNGGNFPMFTSCSPGWVKFVEEFYPEYIDHLSTCKSPQQMLGAISKHYWAKKNGVDPKDVFMVSIMPCTAKKFEAKRPENFVDGIPDIDVVLTTRETAKLLKFYGVDLSQLDPETADLPFGNYSTAGKLFAATGGVMEAALRSVHFLLTGKEIEDLKLQTVRGLDGIKTATLKINDIEVNIAVASGLGNARKIMDDIKHKRKNYHFVEIMSCPGGCINGGGQPYSSLTSTHEKNVRARMQALYNIDQMGSVRQSHKNQAVIDLYDDFLKRPLSDVSHHLLHTHYHARKVVK